MVKSLAWWSRSTYPIVSAYCLESRRNANVPQVLYKVLRDMAMESRGAPGLKYSEFKKRLATNGFSHEQSGPLKLRLQLLEAFMEELPKPGAPSKPKKTDVWNFEKGSLTIIDLSCPFVNENDACALFSICLSLFMEGRSIGGRIVALDEAHKVSIPPSIREMANVNLVPHTVRRGRQVH
jgi:hypothetical protein